MGKIGCVIVAILAVVIGGFALWGVSQYNGLVGVQQEVDTQWGNVQNAYQRRADLIPNLVATVKGSAKFEQDTLTQVIEARSRVGQISPQATAQILNDPQKFEQFQKAQDGLSSALSRLLVVSEQYPQLRSTEAFTNLMSSLEGTENRIAVERNRFNEVARGYNTRVKQFPASLFISVLGWNFPPKPYFAAAAGSENAPKVDFTK
ncbi:MAG TPA: LemA family protein [Thermoanaerobaculia bacterium]|nr:LemA family protein [Thermoanaerobaculia bacterium]